jgi:hypothetical protein
MTEAETRTIGRPFTTFDRYLMTLPMITLWFVMGAFQGQGHGSIAWMDKRIVWKYRFSVNLQDVCTCFAKFGHKSTQTFARRVLQPWQH